MVILTSPGSREIGLLASEAEDEAFLNPKTPPNPFLVNKSRETCKKLG
jgi:hypothetical protein